MNRRSDHDIFAASREAGYVGGGYYNPVDEFVHVARPLISDRLSDLCRNTEMSLNAGDEPTYLVGDIYTELQSLLLPGELLFAMYDKGKFKIAAYIHSEERLMDFEVQISSTLLVKCGFFAVERHKADKGLTREFRSADTEHNVEEYR